MTNRQFVMTLVAVLIVLTVMMSLSSLVQKRAENTQAEWMTNRSIYNMKPSGYRAWYETMKAGKVGVRPWRKSFMSLDDLPRPSTMLVLEPFSYSSQGDLLTKDDLQALLYWVAEGNTLVFIDDFRRSKTARILNHLHLASPETDRSIKSQAATLHLAPGQGLLRSFVKLPVLTEEPNSFPALVNGHPKRYDPKEFGLEDEATDEEPATLEGLQSPEAEPANEASEAPAGSADPPEAVNSTGEMTLTNFAKGFEPQAVVLDAANRPYVIQGNYGKGKILVGTFSDLADNSQLHRLKQDNFQFFTNLLVQEGHPVYINEYIHGYGDEPDIFQYYGKTPLGKVFIQLLILLGLLLWASFSRWKPVFKPLSQETPVDPMGFIRSLSTLYGRAQATSLVVEPLLANIESILRSRYRMELSETNRVDHLLQSLSGDYSNNQSRLRWVQKAATVVSEQKRLSPRETLELVRQLSRIQRELQHSTGSVLSPEPVSAHRQEVKG